MQNGSLRGYLMYETKDMRDYTNSANSDIDKFIEKGRSLAAVTANA